MFRERFERWNAKLSGEENELADTVSLEDLFRAEQTERQLRKKVQQNPQICGRRKQLLPQVKILNRPMNVKYSNCDAFTCLFHDILFIFNLLPTGKTFCFLATLNSHKIIYMSSSYFTSYMRHVINPGYFFTRVSYFSLILITVYTTCFRYKSFSSVYISFLLFPLQFSWFRVLLF